MNASQEAERQASLREAGLGSRTGEVPGQSVDVGRQYDEISKRLGLTVPEQTKQLPYDRVASSAKRNQQAIEQQPETDNQFGIKGKLFVSPEGQASYDLEDLYDDAHEAGRNGLDIPDPEQAIGRSLTRKEKRLLNESYESGVLIQDAISVGALTEEQADAEGIRKEQGQPGEQVQKGRNNVRPSLSALRWRGQTRLSLENDALTEQEFGILAMQEAPP